jgi:hypothetical protein
MILCLAVSSAAAAPFLPPGVTPPDYIVTMELTFSGRKGSSTKVVTRHGEWTRVDSTSATPPETAYYRHGSNAYATDNGWISFFHRNVKHEIGYQPRNTGERQTHLGENCAVWETARSKPDSPARDSFLDLSCFTDDGIELWHRRLGAQGISWSAEALRIEPVAAEEVRLPRALLTLNWWDRRISSSVTTPDHETVMEVTGDIAFPDESKPALAPVRTTRRAGPWLFKEVIAGTQRKIEISHDSIRMRLTYESGGSDVQEVLTIARPNPESANPEPASPSKTFEPFRQDRYDTVLSERCRWFTMTPTADAGTYACLTDDGIVLKEENFSRISRRTWTATRLVRRPVTIDEVKPPAELLQPRTWDLD